jgi:hypothetical protein
MRYLGVIIFLIIVNPIAWAQDSGNRRQLNNQVFYSKVTVQDFIKPGSKWGWDLDMVYRRQSRLGEMGIDDRVRHPLRISIRPWIAYQPTKYTRVSFNPIGIFNSAPRYPRSQDANGSFERELRTTLQINTSSYYERFNFTHRLRMESRWRGIDDTEGATHNWRIRYRIRTRIPLNTTYFYTNHTWYISMYSEAHVEFGRNYGLNNLSQNRNYVGMGYRFWDWARVELGYLHQYNVRGNLDLIDFSRGPFVYFFIDYLSALRLSR